MQHNNFGTKIKFKTCWGMGWQEGVCDENVDLCSKFHFYEVGENNLKVDWNEIVVCNVYSPRIVSLIGVGSLAVCPRHILDLVTTCIS